MRDSSRQFKERHFLFMFVLLCLSPLVGVLYRGLPLAPYLEFPPTTRYVGHAPFQWSAFLSLLLFVAAVCLPFLHRLVSYRPNRKTRRGQSYSFPRWGWLGIVLVLVSWVLAWTRFDFFQILQRYTFFPLWLGYILVINGLSFRRQGSCLLRARPRFLAALFPASALFWWYFEYLNRFVQNWYYNMGDGPVSAMEYVVHATLCFSTVLPAVLSTANWLGTFPLLADSFTDWHRVNFVLKKTCGWLLLAFSGFSLALLAVLPDFLFPLVWIAPLLVITGMQLVTGRPTIFAGLARGDWRPVVLPALAALFCGFFWEMWNWRSLAHWQYSVPFVGRYHLFAMPLLGYAGYLPFGLECAAVADLVADMVGPTEIESS